MDQVVTLDPVLLRFRNDVRAAYGARLKRLVLFGSRARGNHRTDSDYDVAVFIDGYTSRWDEICALSRITTQYWSDDIIVSAKPFPTEAFEQDSPLMREIRKDGIAL